jgi:hypothetical protein
MIIIRHLSWYAGPGTQQTLHKEAASRPMKERAEKKVVRPTCFMVRWAFQRPSPCPLEPGDPDGGNRGIIWPPAAYLSFPGSTCPRIPRSSPPNPRVEETMEAAAKPVLRVAAVCGSLRQASFNRGLLRAGTRFPLPLLGFRHSPPPR